MKEIRLQRYDVLKTMNALLQMAVSFLHTRLENMTEEIISLPELGLWNRKKIEDLLRFRFYKLASVNQRIIAIASLYEETTFPKPDDQITLPFLTPCAPA